MTRSLPEDLRSAEVSHIQIFANERAEAEALIEALSEDERFEHLKRPADAVWRLVADCFVDQRTDFVPPFVQTNSIPVRDITCFLPIEYLTVSTQLQLPHVLVVPVADERVPRDNSWFVLSEHAGSVACVGARGTNLQRMAERAAVVANDALRGIRVALGGQVHASQLRFRLGIGYAFDDQLAGWKRRADEPSALTLAPDSSELLAHPAVAASTGQRNDVERKAALAMTWLERAWETGDDLLALLFRFFALEALLGDKAAGLKAHTIAFREMTLSHVVTGGFRHPDQTFLLYDEVRSGAVHGEHPLELDPKTYAQFEWSVRDALDNYLAFARDRGIARRGKLLRELDTRPDRQQQAEWLRLYGGPGWTNYLDSFR